MQKSSFFAENEGEKGILDRYLFWSHKTCCAAKKDIAPENPDTTSGGATQYKGINGIVYYSGGKGIVHFRPYLAYIFIRR